MHLCVDSSIQISWDAAAARTQPLLPICVGAPNNLQGHTRTHRDILLGAVAVSVQLLHLT